MADPLNLLTENKQQDPLGLLAKTPESQPVSDPFTSSTDTGLTMPSWIDDAMKGVEAGFRMAPFKLGESLLGAVDTIDQYGPGGVLRKLTIKGAELVGINLPKEIRPARDASLYLRNLANQQAPKIGEGTPGYYAQSAVSSILSNVPSIALGFATGSQFIGLLSMAVQVAEDKYNERILAGDSEEKARFGAGLYGAAEAIGEKIPLGILMKNKGIRAILLSSLTEIPSEIATTIMQNGIDIGIYDQDMSFSDWKKSIYDTAIITGISAPFTAGLGRGLGVGAQKIMEKRQAGRVKPVIETQPVTVPVEPSGEGNIEVKTETKGQKVTASIDGKQVGSYDGTSLQINREYEGNRYQIATELLEAHKQAVDALLTTDENGAKKELSDELRTKGLEQTEIAQRQGEIRTGSEAAVSAKLVEETGNEEQKLTTSQEKSATILQMPSKEGPGKPTETVPEVKPEGGKIKRFPVTADASLDALIDHIEANRTGISIGLRGIYKHELGKRRLQKSNDSREFPDGTVAKGKLGGTSVVLVVGDWDSISRDDLIYRLRDASETVKMYGDSGIAIVSGNLLKDEIFNDIGEAVLGDARVIGYLGRVDLTELVKDADERNKPKEYVALSPEEENRLSELSKAVQTLSYGEPGFREINDEYYALIDKRKGIKSLPNPSRSPGEGEQKVAQSYEQFIEQVTQQEQPTKTVEEAIKYQDLVTLQRLAKTVNSRKEFTALTGEDPKKPSKLWEKWGFKNAGEFWAWNHKKKSVVQIENEAFNTTGYLNVETGELIPEYTTADLASLNSLEDKLNAIRNQERQKTDNLQSFKNNRLRNAEISLEKVKSVIRERTGQTRVDNLVKEMDALEFAYKTAEKASRDAYKQGDRTGALREHERMTLIQQLKKARTDMNRETRATFKYLDSVNKKLDTMKIPDEYRDAIRSALSYDGDGIEMFSLRQLEKNDLVFIPEDMIETLKDTERDGITLDQLRNQKDIVKTLLFQARALNKIEVLNEKVAFADTVNTIVNEIGQAWEIDASTLLQRLTPDNRAKQARLGYEGVSRFGEIRDRVRGILSYVKKAEYIIERAVNAARDTRLYQSTFGRAVIAERVEILNGKEINDKLKEAVALIKDDLNSITRDEYTVPGLLNPITKQKAIMIALNSGRPNNRAAMKAGYGLTDANIDAVTASLNDKETEFVLRIWDLMNSQFEKISEQYKKLTGLPMPKAQGQYFPLKYDTSVPQTAYVAEQQSKQDLFRTYSEIISVYRGFTKKAVKQTSYPPLLDFSVITRHLADVNHFIAWGVPVRDINRIFTNPMVKEALIQSVGEEQYSQLRPWLKGIANDHFDTLKYADSLLGKLVNNSSVAILGYALSTTVLQPSAVLQAVNYKYEGADGKIKKIGVNEIIQGVIDFYKSYGENADLVYSLSPFMMMRTNNMDFNIRQAMEADTKHPFNDRKFRRAAFAMMGFTDKLTTVPVWWTAYNIEMKESGDLQRAVDFADKVVRNTQASGAAKDLSEMQRGGNVRRAFTMFQTFFNSTYNEWGKTKDLVQGERVGSLEYAKTFMWICLLPAMLQALFRYREDMLEDPLQKVAKETTAYGFGSIPIFGSFVNSLMGKYEFRPTPAVSLPTELIKLTYSKDVPAFLKHGIAATGYLTGIPSRQMLLTGEYIFDMLEGDETDPLNMIYKKPKR